MEEELENRDDFGEIDDLTTEPSEEVEEWMVKRAMPKIVCKETEVPDEDEFVFDEKEFCIPPQNFDEFDTSSGDLTSECSVVPKQNFATYRPQETTEQMNQKNNRYSYMFKLVKYLKGGGPAAVNCVLDNILYIDLRIDQYIYAIEDSRAMEIFINLAEVAYIDIKLKALTVIARITRIPQMQHIGLSMGLCKTAVSLLSHSQVEVVLAVLKILANITKNKFGRTSIRKNNAIPYVVMLADIDRNILYSKINLLPPTEKVQIMMALYAVRIMRNISKCPKGRESLFLAGTSLVLYDLLRCNDFLFVTNALYIFLNCVRCDLFRGEFAFESIHEIMIDLLSFKTRSIVILAARYLSTVCEDEDILTKILEFGMLGRFLAKINVQVAEEDFELYSVILSILYRISRRPEVLDELQKNDVLKQFADLTDMPVVNVDNVTTVWRMVADLATFPANWSALWNIPGMKEKLLYNLNYHMFEDVKGSVARIFGLLAHNDTLYEQLAENDILLRLWTLIKLEGPYTVGNACRALLPVLNRTKNAGEYFQRIRGGIFDLTVVINSDEPEIMAGGILVMAKLISNKINLEVMSSMGAIGRAMSFLNKTKNKMIRTALCFLIAGLASHSDYNFQFGREGTISLLLNYLRSDDLHLKVAAAFALWKLSVDPVNCIILYRSGVAEVLMECLLTNYKDLQTAAGACLFNIRNLAFNAEVKKLLFFYDPVDETHARDIKRFGDPGVYDSVRGEIEEPLPEQIVKPTKKVTGLKKKTLYDLILEDSIEIEDIQVEYELDTVPTEEVDLMVQWGAPPKFKWKHVELPYPEI